MEEKEIECCNNRFDYSTLDNIDYIIFTAAVSGPDQCAEEFDLCWKVNVDGTLFFITEAIKRKCKVLFFQVMQFLEIFQKKFIQKNP